MKFIPRFEAPRYDNKYYLTINYGGYNRCLDINNGSVLPNCVGYAYARFMECQDLKNCRLSTGDAKNFYSNTADGYARGQEPKLGAIICFDGGKYGHLAVVEEITDEYINCSNSMYGGSKFYMKKYYKKDGYSFQGNTGYYKCQGFIYPEVEFKDEEPEPTPVEEYLKEGTKVFIKGNLYYTAFDDTPVGYTNGKETTITRICKGAKHPYNTTGDLGWMDKDAVRKVEETFEPIKKGDWVVPTSNVDYNGNKVVQYDDKYQVTELNGDRAVLSAERNGELVTWCAMNVNNLHKA